MATRKDSPGVYIPPPLFYVLTFIAAIILQKSVVIDVSFFEMTAVKVVGVALLFTAFFFLSRSIGQFISSKNTLILIKPAFSLQTTGIYHITRNPMYVGLTLVYLGITCLIGNWWNIILFPILLIVVQQYIMKKEEQYLQRKFGQQYLDYKLTVRRWL